MPEISLEEQLSKMARDWDERARENATPLRGHGQRGLDRRRVLRLGREALSEQILNDMMNICQGKDPSQMRVIEIGCGAGRITRALAGLFGEVHGVDISA